MANHEESSKSSSKKFRNRGQMSSPSMSSFSSSASTSSEGEPTGKSVGDQQSASEPGQSSNHDNASGSEPLRREENPFSFKHFLRTGTQKNYNLTGARPKVSYLPPVAVSPECNDSLEKESMVYSRNPTELPDFVQDHLVIEQCYLNHDGSSQLTTSDIENLPDFALNSMEQRPRHRSEQIKQQSDALNDLPFDLTGSLDRGERRNRSSNTAHSGPLDLPNFDRPTGNEAGSRSERLDFPLDLPLPVSEPHTNNINGTMRNCQPLNESGVTKSLPDFLSDGPIRNRAAPSAEISPDSCTNELTNYRLYAENESLRHELEIARRQAHERSRRIQLLESELASRRAVDHEETAHLEKAMEQVEDNLKRSTRRAVNAEGIVTSLKQEIKTLMAEISLLRAENQELRIRLSTASARRDGNSTNLDQTIRRLTGDLRCAASTAEVSLRQLMSGVENLRVLASALENIDRIEDRTKDFVPDFDDDNAAGPAL